MLRLKMVVYNPTERTQYYPWFPGKGCVHAKQVVETIIEGDTDPRKQPGLKKEMVRCENAGKVKVWFSPFEQLADPSPAKKHDPAVNVSLLSRIPRNADGTFAVWRIPVSGDAGVLEDTALVLCHYGTSELRVKASMDALGWLLQAKPSPASIVMVEAIRKPGDVRMESLAAKHGMEYVQRTIGPRSEGVFMKEALWSIGGRKALENKDIRKLLFVDADCAFVHQDWAGATSAALDKYDIVSPHWCYYYADQPEKNMRAVYESVGYSWVTQHGHAHPGLAIGVRRGYFEESLQGRFTNQSLGMGDVYMWIQAVGPWYANTFDFPAHVLTDMERSGVRPVPRVGHAGQVAVHRYHGPMQDRAYTVRNLICRACAPMTGEDLEYLEDGMPVWRDTPGGRIAQKAALEMAGLVNGRRAGSSEIRDIYDKYALEEYGAFTEDDPLVVTCLLRSGGSYGPRHVYWLKKQFDKNCRAPFRFVCQTDMEVPGVETVPLDSDIAVTPGWWGQVEHYRDLWGDSSVLTCDLDTVLMRPFTPHRCPKGEFSMLREYGMWKNSTWTVWGGGLTYFRGDFSRVYDQYRRDFAAGGHRRPDFTAMSVQEYIVGVLRMLDVYPHDIETHFCARYYQGDGHPIRPEAHIGVFPSTPKPWDIDPASGIIPKIDPL